LPEHPTQRRKACETKDAKADLASNRKWLWVVFDGFDNNQI